MPFPMAACRGHVSANAAWTPAALGASLLAWYDPTATLGTFSDAGSTAAVLNDPIRRWVNRAGSATINADQATLGNRPLLKQGANGKYYLQPSGANNALRTAYTTAFARDITIALQCRPNDGGSHDTYACALSKNSGNSTQGWLLGFSGTSRKFAITTPGQSSTVVEASDSSDATWYRLAMTVTSPANALQTLYKNGASIGAPTTSTFGQANASDVLVIGEDFTAGNASWKGDLGHIVLVNGVLSAGDLALLDAFLAAEMPT